MSDESPAYYLDIPGLSDDPNAREGGVDAGGRPWVGIRFDCCGAYTRVYRSPDGRFYQGRCPRCLKPVKLRVGPGGTSSRFFVAE